MLETFSHLLEPSLALARTNVRLSGNMKMVFPDSNTGFFDTINSNDILTKNIFKAKEINFNVRHQLNVKRFVSQITNIEQWYKTKEPNKQILNDYDQQYNDLYNWGVKSREDSLISGEYRFFAPLWVTQKIPDLFCIFRVDGDQIQGGEILKNTVLIKTFDLRTNSPVGLYLNKITSDNQWKEYPLFWSLEGDTKYYGIDVRRGTTAYYSENVQTQLLANERTILESDNHYTNGWQRGGLFVQNLLNLEFTFDDPNANFGFNNYFGCYLSIEEFEELEIENLDQNKSIVLNNRFDDLVHQFKIYDENDIYEDSLEFLRTEVHDGSINNLNPIVLIEVKFNPKAGSKLKLTYDSNIEVDINIKSTDIDPLLLNTIDNIVTKINNASISTTNISITSSRVTIDGKNYILIKSNSQAKTFENIEVEIPASCSFFKPIDITTTYNNTFYGSFKNSLITTNTSFLGATKVRYFHKTLGLRTVNIKRIIPYYDAAGFRYIIELDDSTNPKININTNKYTLLKSSPSTFSFGKYVDFVSFDYDQLIENYNNPVDFDINAFQEYLLGVIDEDGFVGGWENTDPFTLDEYKDLLRDNINSFFSNISYDENFLLKDIDPISLEASTVGNEYDRFLENYLQEFLTINRKVEFINKWGHFRGTDVYFNPYRLNTNLAFRTDNFAPNLNTRKRDLKFHSLSLPIIGEGQNPYSDNTRTLLGYSNERITETILLDELSDAYELLEEKSGTSTEYLPDKGYSYMYQKDGLSEYYYAFFRGIEFRLRGNYDGYKFSVILLTRELVDLDDSDDFVKLIDNKAYKTLSLVIKFYIPDPILTSLERGSTSYYLDRSLLYFIQDVLQVKGEVVSFGREPISLEIANDTSEKFFLDQSVGSNWFIQDSPTEFRIWVGRGLINRFNRPFDEILELGDNLEWYLNVDSGSGFVDAITYRAINIIDVSKDYFWCESIELDYDGNTYNLMTDYFNWIDVLMEEGTIFDKQNLWYTMIGFSKYNCEYDIQFKSSDADKRFARISSGAILKLLDINNINYVTSDNPSVITTRKLDVIKPDSSFVINRVIARDNSLILLNEKLSFPIDRIGGHYSPIFRRLMVANTLESNGNIYPKTIFNTIVPITRYLSKVGNIVLDEILDFDDNQYPFDIYTESFIRQYNDNDLYRLYTSLDEYESISGLAYLQEYKNLFSSNFKANDTYETSFEFSGRVVQIDDRFKTTFLGLLFGNGIANGSITITDDEKLKILKLYEESINEDNINDFDWLDKAYKNAFLGVISKKYIVSKVTLNGEPIPYKTSKNTIIFDEDQSGTILINLSLR